MIFNGLNEVNVPEVGQCIVGGVAPTAWDLSGGLSSSKDYFAARCSKHHSKRISHPPHPQFMWPCPVSCACGLSVELLYKREWCARCLHCAMVSLCCVSVLRHVSCHFYSSLPSSGIVQGGVIGGLTFPLHITTLS